MVPRFGLAAAAVVAVVLAAAATPATEPPEDPKQRAEAEKRQKAEAAQQAAQKAAAEEQALLAELRKIVVTDLDAVDEMPAPMDRKALRVWQQKQSIRNLARHGETQWMLLLHGDLELVRQACGSLMPEVRSRALAAGKRAVRKAALEAANAQAAGRQPEVGSEQVGIEAVIAVLMAEAAPEEFAAYQAERRQRIERRRQRGRVMTLAVLDAELELSADQRTEIGAALDKAWQDGWTTAVAVNGVHNGQFAPDYAADCIVPSLTPRQLAVWKTWCGQRSWKAAVAQNPQFGRIGGLHGWPGMMAGLSLDDWWGE